MNGHGRNNITILFKKEKKQKEFPDKFEMEKDFSQHESTVKFSDRRIWNFFLTLNKK